MKEESTGGGPSLEEAISREETVALCRSLRKARAALLRRPVRGIAASVGAVAERLLDPGDALRREALALLPESAGLSAPMAAVVLDGMARDWREERLVRLLAREFAEPDVLDGFRTVAGGRTLRALGPELTLHVGAGNVPGVSVTSLIRALLVKSAVLLKPGRTDVVLPVLFARGLAEHDPELARAVAVVYWPGGRGGEAESEALEHADLVVAYGGEASLRAIRDRLPVSTPFLPYHHRVSFGVLLREALTSEGAAATARAASRATAVFDRRGCVSPHLFYVEEGGEVSPRRWAALLAEELRELEAELPSGPVSSEEASGVQQLRGSIELSAAAGLGHELHRDEGVAWTVVYDPEPAFEGACAGRAVRVKPVADVDEVAGHARPFSRHLQTVGYARDPGQGPSAGPAGEERFRAFCEGMARAGAFRFAPFDRLPWPPPWWHHDGRAPLGALVRWVELEDDAD